MTLQIRAKIWALKTWRFCKVYKKQLSIAGLMLASFYVGTYYPNNTVSKCIDYVEFGLPKDQHIPKAIIIAMAMMESDNGSSRFALEGNNLFGIRTWDPAEPQMKAYYQLSAKWGLKKYRTKCASVQDMVTILNTKQVHKDFQYERNRQITKSNPDINKIIDKLDKWATNPNYREGLKQIIADNLKEFKD